MNADFNLVHLIILALGTYRISRFFIEDVLFTPVRDRIWAKWPPNSTKIGYLFTCYWCMSLWIALAVVVLYLLLPLLAVAACTVLALSAIAGVIDHMLSR